MKRTYQVAGHLFEMSGKQTCHAADSIPGFKPFGVAPQQPLFTISESKSIPTMVSKQYTFTYEDVAGCFGCTSNGYLLSLQPAHEEGFHLWSDDKSANIYATGNWSIRLYRFAFWVGYGLKTLGKETIAIHSSCIVHQGKAVLFLGESGTGKSTHTRLWCEHIKGVELLNDDSPILRIEEGKVWAYGSPWSGKTPCYRNERYELIGCIRLSQAPYNQIKKLSILQAYGAIHPSCPPEFAYDNMLYDLVSGIIGQLLTTIPFYHLACLPNKEAALLSFDTLFNHVDHIQ